MKYDYQLNMEGRLESLAWPAVTQKTIELSEEQEVTFSDYRMENGALVYDPISVTNEVEEPSAAEKLEAQVTYTAMMTDTLLPMEE